MQHKFILHTQNEENLPNSQRKRPEEMPILRLLRYENYQTKTLRQLFSSILPRVKVYTYNDRKHRSSQKYKVQEPMEILQLGKF